MLSFLCKSGQTRYHFSLLKLVILRHGQSECNQAKKWSGWSDINLTAKGEEEARECGIILKKAGLEFDLAYCSYLHRSIRTLGLILNEL